MDGIDNISNNQVVIQINNRINNYCIVSSCALLSFNFLELFYGIYNSQYDKCNTGDKISEWLMIDSSLSLGITIIFIIGKIKGTTMKSLLFNMLCLL